MTSFFAATIVALQSNAPMIIRIFGTIVIFFLILANTLFLNTLIFVRAFRQDVDRLKVWLKKDTRVQNEANLILEMAQSYLDSGNDQKALECYYQLYRKNPDDTKICYAIARLLSFSDPDEAMIYLKRAASLGSIEAIERLNTINAQNDKAEGTEKQAE